MRSADVVQLGGAHAELVERFLERVPEVREALRRAGATVVVVRGEMVPGAPLLECVQRAVDEAVRDASVTGLAKPVFVVELLRAIGVAMLRPELPVRVPRGLFAGLLLPGEGGAAFYSASRELHGPFAPGLRRFALEQLEKLGAGSAPEPTT